MQFDLLVRNGTVVDGTGALRVRADVGIVGIQIAAIGDLGGDALKVIEAENLVVAPGFVDPHTHYDAQMRWDPVLDS